MAGQNRLVSTQVVEELIVSNLDGIEKRLDTEGKNIKPSFFIPDVSYAIQSNDPFTNRFCRLATKIVLELLSIDSIFNP